MLLPNLTKLGIMVNFELNRGYIAEVLCINKTQPSCNGKCYLARKLKKAEEQQQQKAPSLKVEKSKVLYFHSLVPINFLTRTDTGISIPLTDPCTSHYLVDIFRPPEFDLV